MYIILENNSQYRSVLVDIYTCSFKQLYSIFAAQYQMV